VAKFNLLKEEADYYKTSLSSVLSAKFTFDSIIGQTETIRKAKAMPEVCPDRRAGADPGPTGSGKELFARPSTRPAPARTAPSSV